MDEIKTSKKDLVCVSFFISFFVLAVAGFWVLCFVPAGHCRGCRTYRIHRQCDALYGCKDHY